MRDGDRKTENDKKPFANVVKSFLTGLLRAERDGKSERKLSFTVPEALEVPVARRRAEFAKELLNSSAFVDAIQLMNEEVVTDIVATDPLDTNRLAVLRLRLEVISDFQNRLVNFIDEYSTIVEIKRASRDTQRDFTDLSDEVA